MIFLTPIKRLFVILLSMTMLALPSFAQNAQTYKNLLGKSELFYPVQKQTTVMKDVCVKMEKQAGFETKTTEESLKEANSCQAIVPIKTRLNKLFNADYARKNGIVHIATNFIPTTLNSSEILAQVILVGKVNGATKEMPFTYNGKCPNDFLFDYVDQNQNIRQITIHGLLYTALVELEKTGGLSHERLKGLLNAIK